MIQALTQEQAEEITGAAVQGTGFFLAVSPALKTLLLSVQELNKTSTKVAELVSSYFDVKIPPARTPTAQVEEKESISSIAGRTKERAFDLAKLALIIPLLLNKDAREYLASFLKGLFGTESMEGFNNALKMVGGVLVGVFAYKLFQQIADTFKAFKRLSQLVGTLFGLSEAAANSAAGEKEELEKKRQKDKERRRKSRQAKRKRLQRIKKLKGVVSKFKFAGPFGLIAGIIVGVGIGTMIDLVTNNEEAAEEADEKAEEEDQDPPEVSGDIDTSNLFEIIKNNAIENLTLGLISKETIDNTKKVLAGDEKTIAQNKAAISGMSSGGAEFGESPGGRGGGWEPDLAPKPKEATPSPSATKEESKSVEKEAPVSAPEPSVPPAGETVMEKSEEVASEKKQRINSATNVTVNNIDNSILVKKAA